MLIITNKMWSHVIAEDSDFLERLKNRLTLKCEDEEVGEKYVPIYREIRKGFRVDIPTGIVDSLVLPYVHFETVYDERTNFDINYEELTKQVKQAYNEMALASNGFEVREHQVMGTIKCLVNKRGICQAATGAGKTEIIVSLLKLIKGKILIINNRTSILNQIESRAKFRGVTRKIEYLNTNPNLKEADIVISTNNLIWNKVKNNDIEAMDFLKDVSAIICDECHHGSATSIAIPVMIAEPEYLIGFTASPYKENGNSFEDKLLNVIFGNTFYYISSKYLRDKGYSAYIYAYYEQYLPKQTKKRCRTCADVYKEYVADNFYRNEACLRLVKDAYNNGLKILVMVSRIEHGQSIIRSLKEMGIKSLFMCGGNRIYEATDEKETNKKNLLVNKIVQHKGSAEDIKKALRNDGYNVIVGNVVFNEGLDVPEFDIGILLDAGKNIISHLQRIGRVCRRKEIGLNCALFVDFEDKGHPYLESWLRDRKWHVQREGIPQVSKEDFYKIMKQMGESRKQSLLGGNL